MILNYEDQGRTIEVEANSLFTIRLKEIQPLATDGWWRPLED